jgi:hypothetical protein
MEIMTGKSFKRDEKVSYEGMRVRELQQNILN